MNLPNKLTILRMIMIVPFVIVMLAGAAVPAGKWIALALFIVASMTDFVDGYLARKYNLVTNFGKFMDPIADKLLVNSLFIILTGMGKIHWLVTVIMVGRDIIVDVIRLIMVERGTVIAASKLGKLKTVSQMVALILVLALPGIGWVKYLTYVAAAVSLASGVDYFWKNKKVLLEDVLS